MSFLSKLFGKKQPENNDEPKVLGEEVYGDYKIEALEWKQDSELLLAGKIYKAFDGVEKEKLFIRSDRMHTKDQAVTSAIAKGKQIIDQDGDRLFN